MRQFALAFSLRPSIFFEGFGAYAWGTAIASIRAAEEHDQ